MSEITFNENNPNGPIRRAIVNESGELLTSAQVGGVESTDNSTSTAPTGLTYTGTAELNGQPEVMTTLKTDVDGTLYMEFSVDGTNWDTSLSFNYRTNRINPPHVLVKGNRYYRARFVADDTIPTIFRLNTYYGSFKDLNAPINGSLAENFDSIVVRPTEYHSEVAMGKRQGRTTWNKWGYNDDVDTGSEEIIASWGGTWVPPTSAETVDIVSTSTNDTNGGTGMNSVVIYGIDENKESIIEVLMLSGTTTVTSVNTYFGVNRIAPFLCGSLKYNEGTISAQQTTSTIMMGEIPPTLCATQQCIFFIQANHTFLASNVHVNVIKLSGGGGNPEVTVRGYVYSPVANADIQVFKVKVDTQRENNVGINPTEPFPITEQSVLYFTAETDTNNTSVDVRFSGIEERNS